MRRGFFITVEGTDGSGKTTQINRMKEYVEDKGYEVVLTREPGGTCISEKIREVLLDPQNTGMGEITEMLLYASARAQLVEEVIKPAINSGKVVICDRFIDSSFVYQGFGRGIDIEIIKNVNSIALNGIEPDITFFFDVSPEIALTRRISSTGADRIESEKMDFHMRVYSGYKKLVSLNPDRIKAIDSSRSIDEVAKDVKDLINKLIFSL